LNKDLFIESIHKAKFKNPPADYKKLRADEIKSINNNAASAYMPAQEKGIRPSNALPYEIYVDGKLSSDKKSFEIFFEAKNNIFGEDTAGVSFLVYARKKDDMHVTSYAVLPGDNIKNSWNINDFENSNYHISVHGPNGFFREFKGNNDDPLINIACNYQHEVNDPKKLTGNIEINFQNENNKNTIEINDHYTKTTQNISSIIVLDLSKTYGWYDFTVKIKGNNLFEKRYAGRVETGKESFTDPMMGGMMI
jgi:phospholipase C